MTGIPDIIIRIYFYLLHLYPTTFRKEFQEQMLLDFSDMISDAHRKGNFTLILFCLRELIDFPVNLLRIHMREGPVFKILRSPPVNNGLRGALGFGAAFALSSVVSGLIYWIITGSDNSILDHLQAFYFDAFNKDSELLFNWIFFAVICSGLTGLVLGILFAILFAERSEYPRYILVGMLGWVLHDAVNGVLGYFFNLPVFLSDRQYLYFTIMASVLSGSFLGLIFIVAKNERRGPVRLMVAGAFAYPLISYLYVKQLFNIFIFTTPWRIVSLAILMVILIGSVFVIAIKSESGRKTIWVVIAGAVGYPVMSYLMYFIAQLISPPMPSWGIIHSERPFFWLEIAVSNGAYGILFGLLVGLVLGFQKKNSPSQIIA